MSGLIIEVASRRFGSVQALDTVSLYVQAGEFVVLLGPSGSGKTTLLRALAGLETLDAGRITLGGRVVEDASRGLRVPPEERRLGMVFQEYALWPHLSALENVALPLREARHRDWRERARRTLERVGLDAHAARFPFELSGGQQQRVALARALAGEPEVLLFDEPLSNLDAQLRDELRLEIAQLTREGGVTAVYITHDQAEAFFLADRLGVMRAGQLVQFAPPEEVYAAPATLFVAGFTGAAGQVSGVVDGGAVRCGTVSVTLPAPARLQGPVRLALRPDALILHDTPQPNAFTARPVHCAYVGGFFQVWLTLDSGERVLAHCPHRVPDGTVVWITLDPQRTLVYADAALPAEQTVGQSVPAAR
ncbi:ABC-type Fe3+/spermidine/putrescine transport system ATPase subunit [Deinococcus metalli]|uniref:ABC-type Fe3+/spermidine/putrescine transport system ATPase subunit n=1 Tax=Deinococcus metalli TaxID=1141878 RepID=A0A7W8KJ24_9DEIO|nr:ABC transporter ATP-binding protein [Deinococcus metalli]MBB5378688.1 ABC-type Fe3+/spermidine/putrescine transport system ATPase subunit [Deinococcus metalli]GHF61715.1 sugar ABC transporter ATP-binding protein [Deinococcus metalli]